MTKNADLTGIVDTLILRPPGYVYDRILEAQRLLYGEGAVGDAGSWRDAAQRLEGILEELHPHPWRSRRTEPNKFL